MAIKTYLKLTYSVVIVLLVISHFGILAQSNSSRVYLDEWDAPVALKKAFPYYITGIDYEGQPVFVFEYGKWDVRKYYEDGGDKKTLDLYWDQLMHRWSRAEKNLANFDRGTGFFGLIVDMDGYEVRQLAHANSLAFILDATRKYVAGPGDKMDYAFVINMNYVAETLVKNLVAPILGNIFSKVETSGTNQAKWIPLMLKKIPKESLPTWYGGTEQFKPLAVYG